VRNCSNRETGKIKNGQKYTEIERQGERERESENRSVATNNKMSAVANCSDETERIGSESGVENKISDIFPHSDFLEQK